MDLPGKRSSDDTAKNFINIHLPGAQVQSNSSTELNLLNNNNQHLPTPQQSKQQIDEPGITNNPALTSRDELKRSDSVEEEQNYNLYYDKLLESYVNKQENIISEVEEKLADSSTSALPLLTRRSKNLNTADASGMASTKLVVLPNHTTTSKFSYDMNSVEEHVLGAPFYNGFVMKKVNPGTERGELSYLNRNKLINRRLSIKKQLDSSSGLQPITARPDVPSKVSTGFRIANPELLQSMEVDENVMRSPVRKFTFGDAASSFRKSQLDLKSELVKDSTTISRFMKDIGTPSRSSMATALKKSKSLVLISEK
jgi:hypothetical protein